MILPGLRSEEMGKEKNTRENKSQSNVNTGRTERSCLSPRRKPENTFCCQEHLDRTHALVKAIHLPMRVSHWTVHNLSRISDILLSNISIILPKNTNDYLFILLHLMCIFYISEMCFVIGLYTYFYLLPSSITYELMNCCQAVKITSIFSHWVMHSHLLDL